MEYLTLNNNTQMPLVGFGTFLLNGKTCTTAVASATQTGYRMIDTAEAYGNEKKIAHMAYAPLGQGNRNEMYQEPVVLALAEKYNKTPAQILLRFLTQKKHCSDSKKHTGGTYSGKF